MHEFAYHCAASIEDAVRRLAEPGVMALGGGTDLLVFVQEGLATPDALVDLRAVDECQAIVERPDRSVRIGAAVRVHEIASSPIVRDRFPVLARSAALVGSPALRNMGTLGGNLCQRPRCWYFRRNIPCLKNGGEA